MVDMANLDENTSRRGRLDCESPLETAVERHFCLAPLTSMVSNLKNGREFTTGKLRSRFWHVDSRKESTSERPHLILTGTFQLGTLDKPGDYVLQDGHSCIRIVSCFAEELWKCVDLTDLIGKHIFLAGWNWVPPPPGQHDQDGYIEMILKPGLIGANHFLATTPSFQFTHQDWDPLLPETEQRDTVMACQLLDLERFDVNDPSIASILDTSATWKRNVSIIGVVQAKSVMHIKGPKDSNFFFVEMRLTYLSGDDDGIPLYLTTVVHIATPSVYQLHDAIRVGSHIKMVNLNSAVVMQGKFRVLAWTTKSQWEALPHEEGLEMSLPCEEPSVVTYIGTVTSWCGPNVRMFLLDDLYPVFFLRETAKSLQTDVVRVGTRIALHNIHLVKIDQFDSITSTRRMITIMAGCSYTTLEILSAASELKEDYDATSVERAPLHLQRYMWFRDPRNWAHLNGTSVPIAQLSTPELVATVRMIQQLKEKIPGQILDRGVLFGTAAQDKDSTDSSVVMRLLAFFGFRPLTRNVWLEFLDHAFSCTLAANRFKIPQLLHLERILGHKALRNFSSDPVSATQVLAGQDYYSCREFTQSELGLHDVALCGLLVPSPSGGMQLVDLGIGYMAFRSECETAKKDGKDLPLPSRALIGTIACSSPVIVSPQHFGHVYIIRDYIIVAQKFGISTRTVTKIHARIQMNTSVCVFRNPKWPNSMNPLASLDILKPSLAPLPINLPKEINWTVCKSMLLLVTAVSPITLNPEHVAGYHVHGMCINVETRKSKRFHMDMSWRPENFVEFEMGHGPRLYSNLRIGQVYHAQNVKFTEPYKPFGGKGDAFGDVVVLMDAVSVIVPITAVDLWEGKTIRVIPRNSKDMQPPKHDILGKELEHATPQNRLDYQGMVEVLQAMASQLHGRSLEMLSVRDVLDHADGNGTRMMPFHNMFEHLVNVTGVIQSVSLARPANTPAQSNSEFNDSFGLGLHGRLLSLQLRDLATADTLQLFFDLGQTDVLAGWIDDIVPGRVIQVWQCARRTSNLARSSMHCVTLPLVTRIIVSTEAPPFPLGTFLGFSPRQVAWIDQFLLPTVEWQRKKTLVRLHARILRIMEVQIHSHCNACSLQVRERACPNKCEPRHYEMRVSSTIVITDGTAEALGYVDNMEGIVGLLGLDSALVERLQTACETFGVLKYRNQEETFVEKEEELPTQTMTNAQAKKARLLQVKAASMERLLAEACMNPAIYRDVVLVAKRVVLRVDPALEDPTGFRRPTLKAGKLPLATLQHPKISLRIIGLRDLNVTEECYRLIAALK